MGTNSSCAIIYSILYRTMPCIREMVLRSQKGKEEKEVRGQESDLQSLMVLSFSRAPEAIMFSVGWHAVHSTTSTHNQNSHDCH